MQRSLKYLSMIMLTLSFLFSTPSTYSSPSRNRVVEYVQPDGSTVSVIVKGDEFFNYMITVGGDVVSKGGDGYLYYSRYDEGGLEISSVRVSSAGRVKSLAGTGGVSGSVIRQMRSQNAMWQDLYGTSTRSVLSKSTSKVAHPGRGLVLIVEFQDKRITKSVSDFSNMMNTPGYSYNGAVGSIKDYFKANSQGKYDPTFDVYGVFRLSKNMSYYGAKSGSMSDVRPREMIAEVCDLAFGSGVDFSKYDSDGDGKIDMVYVYYAGYSEAEGATSDAIWPHKWSASNMNRTYNGKRLDIYACSNELRGVSGITMTGIGTFCHEFSHVLGLVDLYDTDYKDNGEVNALESLSLMDAGIYNADGNSPPYYNLLERELAGWQVIPELPTGSVELKSVQNGGGYKVSSSVLGEYFLLEVRDGTGWDAYLSGKGPLKGMLIYNVDFSSNRSVDGYSITELWKLNKVNAYSLHPCVRLIPASGGVFYGVSSSIFYPGSQSVTSVLSSEGKVKDWDGVPMLSDLTSITQNASSVSFNVGKNNRIISGYVSNSSGGRLSGVTVKLIEVVSSTKSQTLLSKSSFYSSNNVGETVCVTNGNGEYLFNTAKGVYDIVLSRYGYVPVKERITVGEGDVICNYELKKEDNSIQRRISYGRDYDGYLTYGGQVSLCHKYSAEFLLASSAVDRSMNAVYFYTFEQGLQVTIRILVNGVEKYWWQVVTGAGLNVSEIPSGFIIPSGSEVELQVAGLYSVFIDEGPAVEGRGDVVKFGDSWNTLKQLGFNNNVCIGFWTNKGSNELSSPNVRVKYLGQRGFTLGINSDDADFEAWVVKVGDKRYDLSPSIHELNLNGLQPNTSYMVDVTTILSGKSGQKVMELKTRAITAPFAAIELFFLGNGQYSPHIINEPKEIKSATWTLNGKSFIDRIDVSKSGKYNLVCRVVWYDGSEELLEKVINIK